MFYCSKYKHFKIIFLHLQTKILQFLHNSIIIYYSVRGVVEDLKGKNKSGNYEVVKLCKEILKLLFRL